MFVLVACLAICIVVIWELKWFICTFCISILETMVDQMLDSTELTVFVTAARHLNFARTAKELHLSPAQVSKSLSALEKKIKKKLFVRTTRSVRITQDGELLLPLAKEVLQTNRDAEERFYNAQGNDDIAGNIRCTSANTLGIRALSQAVSSFTAKHPKVTFEIILTDSYMNLYEDDIDVAVRVMALHESSLISRKLADNPVVFCASPSYLKKHGRPKSVGDLRHHQVYFIPQHAGLVFRKSKSRLDSVTEQSRITVGSGDFIIELAKGGSGIIARSMWGVARELKDGSLVKLDLDDSLVSTTSIYAVYAKNHFMPRRLKLWIDHLVESFKSINHL
jgi:DNA-binding transcriptional LysR family regulator